MKTVHLYPLSPAGTHGGTLRLRTALDASDDPQLVWYDGATQRWRTDATVEPSLKVIVDTLDELVRVATAQPAP